MRCPSSVLLVGGATLAAAFVGGCGGAAAKSLDALWHGPGEQVSLIAGTADFAAGDVRLSFLVVGGNGRPVYRPTARIWLAPKLDAAPVQDAVARLEPVGPAGKHGDGAGVKGLYVVHMRIARPGTWWVLARPEGGRIGAVGTVVVRARSLSPALGSLARPSRTPTLASAHEQVQLLTTRVPPDRSLLRYSIADSVRAHVPFVVVFATPKFCESRTCGPVTDVVLAVQRRFEASGVRFIHVEIYTGNVVARGKNRWVREWHLPSEPWTFLVGRDGRIKAKFEGSVSVGELDAAVRSKLLGG